MNPGQERGRERGREREGETERGRVTQYREYHGTEGERERMRKNRKRREEEKGKERMRNLLPGKKCINRTRMQQITIRFQRNNLLIVHHLTTERERE